jgi:DUF4097 and DUF4098 domain-containing protein YvlB
MEERVERTFSTPDGCDLTVENVRGKISVEGWDRSETAVVAIQHHGKAEIEITQNGRKVTAQTKNEQSGLAWLKWLSKGEVPRVDYEVRVPNVSNVRLKNVHGPITASSIEGSVSVNNVDGTATLDQITGQTDAETVNGTLTASDLNGVAKLSTVNGKMKVLSGSLHELKADTVNGGIDVMADLSDEGTFALHTVNGGCRLVVPPGFRAHVSAQGVNMSVACQVPHQSEERKFGSWHGTIGEGDGPYAEIRFETVNGRLQIDNEPSATETSSSTSEQEFVAKADPVSAAPSPPAAPNPPYPGEPVQVKVAPPPHQEASPSQTEILQRVERGEISVDEAIKLLQGED